METDTRSRDTRPPATEAAVSEDREFSFSTDDYAFLRAMLKEKSGIELGPTKQNMVYARLAKRLRKLGFQTLRDYIQFIGTPAGGGELGDRKVVVEGQRVVIR